MVNRSVTHRFHSVLITGAATLTRSVEVSLTLLPEILTEGCASDDVEGHEVGQSDF